MLVVVSLCQSSFERRVEPRTVATQRAAVRAVAKAVAPLAAHHQLVIVYGHGPQASMLALQGAACAKLETWPLDVLDLHIEEMTAYLLEHELSSLLPAGRPLATVQTMVEIDPDDPAFRYPSKPVGPLYLREEAKHVAAVKDWVFKPDGDKWRRVVAAPEPKRIVELRPIKWLLEHDTVVIAAGGGGIPAFDERGTNRRVAPVECIVDKDLAAELLARALGADLFLILTSADAVYVDWGKPSQRAIRRASPDFLLAFPFGAGSMGPKVTAACRFAAATGKPAAIGAGVDIERILEGEAGTKITLTEPDIAYALPLAGDARA